AFHVTNLILHIGSTLLLMRLLLILTPRRLSSLTLAALIMAALVFAVHPFQAEPVAWLTGRKDVLSGFFAMLALVLHVNAAIRSVESPRTNQAIAQRRSVIARHLFACFSFVLALLA